MAGHPLRGRHPSAPAAESSHRACKPRGQCWAPTPAHPRPQHMGSGPRQPAQRTGSRRKGERLTSDAAHNGERYPPRGRPSATPTARMPARKGARCGAGAGSPRPQQPHPGHTGRGTPAARLRGRAVGGGTAPDTGRPSERWQATPPGDGPPPPPLHGAPTGQASKGDSAGPPLTRTPAPTAHG